MADDDPYLARGRQVLSGGTSTEGADAAPDPYVAAGKEVLAATPTAATGGPDPSKAYSVENSWLGIPSIHNFAGGVTQGARDVLSTGANVAKWVDERVPILNWLDQKAGISPDKISTALDEARKNYEEGPEGQSYTGGAGRLVGGVAATLPITLGAGAGLRLGGLAASRLMPYAAPVIRGLGELVSGSAAVPEAGVVPNLITRGSSLALQGATQGAGYGALTSGGSDKSVSDNVVNALEMGMMGGPIIGTALGTGKVLGRAVGGAYDYVTGRGAARQVEETMAAARARATAGGGEGTPPPPPGGSAPGASPPTTPATPQPGGAAATSEAELAATQAAQTNAQATAQKLRNFDLEMEKKPTPGDWTEHVEGSRPTTAEALKDPHLAAIQRNVTASDQRMTNLDESNVEARVDHWRRNASDPVATQNLEDARAAQGTADLQTAWRGKSDTTAEPVKKFIEETYKTEAGKLGPVEDALKTVERRLHVGNDLNAPLETDPQQLYGARRQITYMLSKTGQRENPAYGTEDVQSHLIQAREIIDQQILKGAPNFQKFLDNWRAASPQIDKENFLQKFHLADAGKMTLAQVDQMLRSVRSGIASGPAHPAQALTDADLYGPGGLFALRRDLQREANRKLTMPIGSPTAANLDIGAQLGINAATSALGNLPVVGRAAGPAANWLNARNVAQIKERYIQQLLHPHPLTPPE